MSNLFSFIAELLFGASSLEIGITNPDLLLLLLNIELFFINLSILFWFVAESLFGASCLAIGITNPDLSLLLLIIELFF